MIIHPHLEAMKRDVLARLAAAAAEAGLLPPASGLDTDGGAGDQVDGRNGLRQDCADSYYDRGAI